MQYEQNKIYRKISIEKWSEIKSVLLQFITDCTDPSNSCPSLIIWHKALEQIDCLNQSNYLFDDVWKHIHRICDELQKEVKKEFWRQTPAYQVMSVVYIFLMVREEKTIEENSFANEIANVVFARHNFTGTLSMANGVIQNIHSIISSGNDALNQSEEKTLSDILEENKNLSTQLETLKMHLSERPTTEDMNQLRRSIEELQNELAKYRTINDNYIEIDKLFAEASKIEDASQLATIRNYLHALELDRKRINSLKCSSVKMNIEQLNMGNGIQTKQLPK